MALIDINFHPSARQLRQFAAACLIAAPLGTWLWTHNSLFTGWAAAIGLLICGTGIIAPPVLRPVFIGLSLITLPIGLIVGELAMVLLYFGVFLPMSMLSRMAGRDSLQRRPQPDSNTWWEPRKLNAAVRSYYRQF